MSRSLSVSGLENVNMPIPKAEDDPNFERDGGDVAQIDQHYQVAGGNAAG